MKIQEIVILGKTYSFYTDDPAQLDKMGTELNAELEILEAKYNNFTRDHLLLLQLLRDRLDDYQAVPQSAEENQDYLPPKEDKDSEQLDLEIEDILNTEI